MANLLLQRLRLQKNLLSFEAANTAKSFEATFGPNGKDARLWYIRITNLISQYDVFQCFV